MDYPLSFRWLLPIIAAVTFFTGCSERIPDVSYKGHQQRHFESIDDFLACREVFDGTKRSRVIVDHMGAIRNLHGRTVFCDFLHADERFTFDLAVGDYDAYCLRGARNDINDPHLVHGILFCTRRGEVVRWEAVPNFIGTDGYNLAIASEKDMEQLQKWLFESDEAWNKFIDWIMTGTSATGSPDGRFGINDLYEGNAVFIYCGKVLVFFTGYDAEGKLIAVQINVF